MAFISVGLCCLNSDEHKYLVLQDAASGFTLLFIDNSMDEMAIVAI
jgi:hypothetical protein